MPNCNKCGEEAYQVCGGCRRVTYCNAVCLRSDWKHHKPSCIFARIKAAVKDLKQREIKWMKNLPREVKGKLTGLLARLGDNRAQCFKYNHHLQILQFALVLVGVNACHYQDMPERLNWSEYTEQFYVCVLKPWYTKHQAFLEKRGFQLDNRFASSTNEEPLLKFCPCNGRPFRAPDCGSGICLTPSCLFYNKKHSDAAWVEKMFFESDSDEPWTSSADGAYDGAYFDSLRSLGMTTSDYSLTVVQDCILVCFDVLDPVACLKDDEACCSAWLFRGIKDSDARSTGEYFAECEKGLLKFGIPIKLEITGNSRNLTSEGYARLVVAAASGDAARATELFDASLQVEPKLRKGKVDSVKELIQEYCEGYDTSSSVEWRPGNETG